MKSMTAALVLAAGTAGSALATAQQIDDTLEVRATRTELPLQEVPAAVTVIDGDQLRSGRLPASLAEALDQVPGLFIQNAGNFSQDARIALRGFGAQSAFGIRGVAVIVDGVPQTLPDGQAQVDSIDLAEVERIEILRGPASALYGNAAGGVILITTRPAGDSFRMGVRQQFGAFGRRDSRVSVTIPVGSAAGLRFSAGRFSQDGFRKHADVEQRRVNLKLDWQPRPATQVNLAVGAFDAPRELDPGGVTLEQASLAPREARPANVRFNAGETLSQWRTSVGLEHEFGEGSQSLSVNGFLFARDFANRLPFGNGGQVDLDRRYGGADLRHQAELSIAGLALNVTSGIDWRQQHDLRSRFNNLDGQRGALVLEQRERVSALGGYVQTGFELGPAWHLTAGLRFDEVQLDVNDRLLADGDASGQRTWSEFSPTLGLNWQPSSNWTLYANYGQVFQTPTTTELANPENPAAGGGFNSALGPETADSVEVGSRWQGRVFSLSASVYRIKLDNAITSFEVPDFSGTGRDFFTNAGRSTRDGIELEAGWQVSQSLRFSVGYSGSDFEFGRFDTADGDFSGNQLPGVPRHRFGGQAEYRGPNGLEAVLALSRVGEFYADNENQATNPARTESRIEVVQRWSAGSWRVAASFGVFNILDQRYNDNVRVNAFGGRYFEPAPDRHVFAGLELGWR